MPQEDIVGTVAEIPGIGITIAMGTTLPADNDLGYAPGCVFVLVGGTPSAGAIVYENVGTRAAANFDRLGGATGYLPLGGGTMDDAANIALATGTGTKIATAVGQKLGFWNATPIVQPASANQAALGTATTVGANTGTAGAGLSLIGDTSTVDQSAALMNDLVALQEDIDALFTLVTAIRTALVNAGIIKGAA